MNTKIIPIILLLVILGMGFVAWTFYAEKNKLVEENNVLKEEKTVLIEENNNLKYRYNKLEQERNNLQQRFAMVSDELTRVEEERDSLKSQVTTVSTERDKLKRQLQRSRAPAATITKKEEDITASEEHWADFINKKAALEAELGDLKGELLDSKAKIAEFDRDNKELSIKIDQLAKEKERLEEERRFKERTLRFMGMDLVKEREERAAAVMELKKLRTENVGLKRELVLSSKEKVRLQERLKENLTSKESLEDKISDVSKVLREKSLAFEELQEQLERAIVGEKTTMSGKSASVELPPIVVKPGISEVRGIRGEVIAVNREEKFVVVDIGESSGVRPGIILKVVRGDKEVGSIEIIETRKDISAANINEVIGGLNIREGDIVVSR